MHFDYGTTTGYGRRTPDVVLERGCAASSGSPPVRRVSRRTRRYHARLVSVGADGTQATSADVTFTSAAAGPTLGAAGAASVGSTTAALNVQVDPNGQSTRYHVDYGDDASYGRSSADVDAGSAEAFADGQAALAGLDPSTTYHYRVVAANASGTSYGPDGTFTTASAGPTLGPPNVLHPAARSGEVSLAVGPNGQATTLHVEYGATAVVRPAQRRRRRRRRERRPGRGRDPARSHPGDGLPPAGRGDQRQRHAGDRRPPLQHRARGSDACSPATRSRRAAARRSPAR